MIEVVGNLHLHTTVSDGMKSHDEVALAAIRAGLDFIIYTDHNISVNGIEGWYGHPEADRKILRLMGQEVHDEELEPERNHLLCYLVTSDLQSVAANPQRLIDTVNRQGGTCFLAHPLERPGYREARQTFPWLSWNISDYTGIEIWNTMTDAKWGLRSLPRALIGAYLPNLILNGPFPEVLAKWDELLANGQKVVGIGSADAHAMSFSLGPLRRTIYPYEYLFRAVNTHLLLSEPLSDHVSYARSQIHEALKNGHCFVGYDLLASPRGFSFTGTSGNQQTIMGDDLKLQETANLHISSPEPAKLRLLKDGQPVVETEGKQLTWQTSQAGVYRVEAYRRFWGLQRGWVFTNPIYVR